MTWWPLNPAWGSWKKMLPIHLRWSVISATHECFLAITFQEAEPREWCNLRVLEVDGLGWTALLADPAIVRDYYQALGTNSKGNQDLVPPLWEPAVGRHHRTGTDCVCDSNPLLSTTLVIGEGLIQSPVSTDCLSHPRILTVSDPGPDTERLARCCLLN